MGIFAAWATAGGFGRFLRHPALSSGSRSARRRIVSGAESRSFRPFRSGMIFNGIGIVHEKKSYLDGTNPQ